MAQEVLALLSLKGSERILDVGCGDGRVTAEIAARVPDGSVVGVDASQDMIAFASRRFDRGTQPNLHFEVADARSLGFQDEFDLAVSFNALHWITDQQLPLRCIHSALHRSGRAQLRLVPDGERKSLETTIEETRLSSRWAQYFPDFVNPYLHMTSEQYQALAADVGFTVLACEVNAKSWDFGTREAFFAFGMVTFVEWTQHLPVSDRPGFVNDVLDRYRPVAADKPGEENTFRFYQMDIALTRAH